MIGTPYLYCALNSKDADLAYCYTNQLVQGHFIFIFNLIQGALYKIELSYLL